MLHYLSIPAADPQHVAATLVALFNGTMTVFGPYRNSYIAWVGDEHGTGIEVYPLGTELIPGEGQSPPQFRHNPTTSPFGATMPLCPCRGRQRRFSRWHSRRAGVRSNSHAANFGSSSFGSRITSCWNS